MSPLRIAFVISQLGVVEPQSPPLLAAIARQEGHDALIVDFGRGFRRARGMLRSFSPDIVAYTVCSNEADRYLDMNRALKRELSFFAAFGGPHPTFCPEFLDADGVDAICRGEGDLVLPRFLRNFGAESMAETPNFSFKQPRKTNPMVDLLTDLDTLPFPARDLLYAESSFMARNPIKGFMVWRGCPNRCSYCFNYRFNEMYRGKGPVLRMKSVSYVIEEVRQVARDYPLTFVRFYDDIFGADRAWLETFAERFPREAGVPFCCNVRPNMVTDDYVRLLKAAGCYSVYTAIECGDERLRNEVLGRNVTDAQIGTACEHLKRHGIPIVSLNMIGLPGETREQILDTLKMNRRLGVDLVDVNVFQPYPGTRIHQYCREHGHLREGEVRFESFATCSILDLPPAFRQWVFVVHKLAALLVDFPGLIRWLPRVPMPRVLNPLWNLWFRFYFGWALHRRIYASKIPMSLRFRGLFRVLFSRNRV